VGVKAVSSLYVKIGAKHPEILTAYVDLVLAEIAKRDNYDLTIFLRQFRRVMTADALPNRAAVIDESMQKYCATMKNNRKYYKATEMCMELFFKLVVNDENVRAWATNPDSHPHWVWMTEWASDNKTPPAATGGDVVMYKKATTTQPWSTGHERPNLKRIELLENLAAEKDLSLPNYDSDIDTVDMDFQVDDKMWALDSKDQKYAQAKVVRIVEHMMHLQFIENERQEKWVDKEEEYLIPLPRPEPTN
jgi:hypothetical protein